MRFDIITIFPGIFESYFNESILKRAQKNRLVEIKVHNLRDWALDKHKTTDDTPYGGGAGMVMKIEPIWRCVQSLSLKCEVKSAKSRSLLRSRTILFSAKGKRYTQEDARRLAKYDNLIMICGRYEGVDERVVEHIADEEISIGDYVLTGGEIPAMVLVDSISRLIPGVLGNADSLNEESFGGLKTKSQKLKANLEYAQYTKPEEFFPEGKSASGGKSWKVPEVLLSGNHREIGKWREEKSQKK